MKIKIGDTIYWMMPISNTEKVKVDLFVKKISDLGSPVVCTNNSKLFGFFPDTINENIGFKDILLIEKWKK